MLTCARTAGRGFVGYANGEAQPLAGNGLVRPLEEIRAVSVFHQLHCLVSLSLALFIIIKILPHTFGSLLLGLRLQSAPHS